MAIGVIEFMNPSWYPFMAEHILGITLDQETSQKGNCAGGFPPPKKKKKKKLQPDCQQILLVLILPSCICLNISF